MASEPEIPLLRPLTPRELVVLDVVAAAVYGLVLLSISLGRGAAATTAAGGIAGTLPTAAAVGLALAMAIPVATRRAWPTASLVVSLGATAIAAMAGVMDGSVGSALVLYIVAASEARPRRSLTRAAAATAILGVALLVLAGSAMPVSANVGLVLVSAIDLAGAWTIGRAVRERRRYAQRASADLVARALAEERLRIARDLHDVVAHGMSLIVVRASTANHLIDTRPEEARDALRVIETTGRAGLVEMRRLLEVLRSQPPAAHGDEETASSPATTVGDAEADADASLAPVPGIAQIPALVERVVGAGVPVELQVDAPANLPDGVSLAAYRIVQEALTNVVRHAAQARCRVTLRSVDDVMEVEIVDDGMRRASPPGDDSGLEPHTGHGLIGMRERARMLGGELSAGALADRGYRVHARLPIASPAAAAEPRSMTSPLVASPDATPGTTGR